MQLSVIDIFELMESDNSRLFKEKLLKEHKDNQLLKDVMVAVLDPYVTYGISKFKMPVPQAAQVVDDDKTLTAFLTVLLPELSSRRVTGNSAKSLVKATFQLMTAQQQKWCERILLRNLRFGATTSTVNKVWPKLIRTFEVALAESLLAECNQDGSIKELKGDVKFPIYVDPKLDGFRCIAIKQNGIVTLFKRSGEIVETAPLIVKALTDADIDNVVFDGELMAETFEATSSVVASSKNKKDDSKLFYHVFDSMSDVEWTDQRCMTPLITRLERRDARVAQINDPRIKIVKGAVIITIEQLLLAFKQAVADNYEGVMLKDLSRPYGFKRSDAVMKLKPYTSWEGVITGWYLGNAKKKWANKFGGFYVQLASGAETRVGGGFNDALRNEIFANDPATYMGKIAETEGQPDPRFSMGLTEDGKIRFPVFLRFRDLADVAPEIRNLHTHLNAANFINEQDKISPRNEEINDESDDE